MAMFGDDEEEQPDVYKQMADAAAEPAPTLGTSAGIDDATARQIINAKLLKRLDDYENSLAADVEKSDKARKRSNAVARDLALNEALARGSSQIGTIAGQQADTSAVSGITSRLLDAQKQDIGLQDKQKTERDRLNQYLTGKMLEQKQSMDKLDLSRNEQAAKAQAEKDKQSFIAAENEKNRKAKAALEAMATSAKKKEGAQVPGSVAADLGQFDSALAMADDAKKSYDAKASQAGSRVIAYIPGSEANQYEKERDVTAQAIGTILEGGKLTEPDYARYKAMLPSPSDTNSVADAKIAALKNLIEQKRKGKVEGLAQTGFDVSKVQRKEPEGFKKAAPPSGAIAAGKPKKVIQNGHEYILNEKTGEYE